MKGPCIWAMMFLSLGINIIMAIFYLRKRKNYSIFTYFAVLIAVCGIFIPIMEGTNFLIEDVNPRFAPEWLYQLRYSKYRVICTRVALPTEVQGHSASTVHGCRGTLFHHIHGRGNGWSWKSSWFQTRTDFVQKN